MNAMTYIITKERICHKGATKKESANAKAADGTAQSEKIRRSKYSTMHAATVAAPQKILIKICLSTFHISLTQFFKNVNILFKIDVGYHGKLEK